MSTVPPSDVYLVQVSSSSFPGFGCEVDVVRVMDLAQVVEAASLSTSKKKVVDLLLDI